MKFIFSTHFAKIRKDYIMTLSFSENGLFALVANECKREALDTVER